MDREQQVQRIRRVRRSIVSTSVTGALALAGYLGITGFVDGSIDTGSGASTTAYDARTDRSGNGFDISDLDPGQLSGGSGSSDATTSGS